VTNLEAIETTVDELRRGGHLADGDAARVSIATSLARAVDTDPGNASLWREYRAAEAALHEVRDSESDDERDLVAALSAAVGDTEDRGPADAGRQGSRRS
jgi:hypothetical protein